MFKPEQLTEVFFYEVLDWRRSVDHPTHWEQKNVDGHSFIGADLPKLHHSLDLQEEWVWPELRKEIFMFTEFTQEGADDYLCDLSNLRSQKFGAKAGTKAEAQLLAALQVLRVDAQKVVDKLDAQEKE